MSLTPDEFEVLRLSRILGGVTRTKVLLETIREKNIEIENLLSYLRSVERIPSSLEQNMADLQRRVAELEKKVGVPKKLDEAILGKLKKIEVEEVRKICADAIEELISLNAEVRSIASEWISVWYKRKRFMYIGCKKRFSVFQAQIPNGTWTKRVRILTSEDWRKYMDQTITPILKSLEH